MYALQRKGKSASYKKKCWSVEDQFPNKLYYVLKEKNHVQVEQDVFNYKALKRKSWIISYKKKNKHGLDFSIHYFDFKGQNSALFVVFFRGKLRSSRPYAIQS